MYLGLALTLRTMLRERATNRYSLRPQESTIPSASRSLSAAVFALFFACATLSLHGTSARAQTLLPAAEHADLLQPAIPSTAYSTSVVPADPEALPDAPPVTDEQLAAATQPKLVKKRSFAPFHRLGIAVTGGTEATGLAIATSMGEHLNLRASGNYFSYYLDFTTEGYHVTGRVITRYANLSLDYFPFHNGFHISPGVALDNGNYVHGNIVIPGNASFDLGDGTYTSDPNAPIGGTVALTFARQVAPTITMGWGNIIPRGRHHWSVPFEIGFEYTGAPKVDFNINQGNACDPTDGCNPVATDPSTLANEQAERTKINNDIYPLRFFPIMSLGFGYSW